MINFQSLHWNLHPMGNPSHYLRVRTLDMFTKLSNKGKWWCYFNMCINSLHTDFTILSDIHKNMTIRFLTYKDRFSHLIKHGPLCSRRENGLKYIFIYFETNLNIHAYQCCTMFRIIPVLQRVCRVKSGNSLKHYP